MLEWGKTEVVCTPLIPTPRRQKQVDFWEIEISLVYIMSFRLVKATEWDLGVGVGVEVREREMIKGRQEGGKDQHL